jgi:hypothetical protein
MSAYTDFLDYVMPHVPGANTNLVTHEIRNACIDFCKRSMVLQRDHDPITVVKGLIDYDFEPPTGYLVVKVMKAWIETRELEPVAPDYIQDPVFYNPSFSGAIKKEAPPMIYVQKDERSVSVYPFPDKTIPLGLTMRVALKPTITSTTVEDFILQDYAEVIASGTLFRLLASPNKPYTEPQLSLAHNQMFMSGINLARQAAARGHVRANQQVKLRRV